MGRPGVKRVETLPLACPSSRREWHEDQVVEVEEVV